MKLPIGIAGAVLFAIVKIASAQTPSPTVDSYIATAKAAAEAQQIGRERFFASAFHLHPGPRPRTVRRGAGRGADGRGTAPRTPARETWYAEPAKVADNLYFLGTKIHSAWAIVGSQGIIVIEALFDYAARDEILDGLQKIGLDPKKVKYVILSHAHADHDGGAVLLQDSIPGVHVIYGAAHGKIGMPWINASAARPSMTWWALTG